ncbi:MAG: single-stranded DNA-binding protein [bacterium]
MYSNSFNECTLIGKCGNDLTLRHTQKGVPVTNLVLGTQDVWRNNRTLEINKSMTWHKVVVWGKLAEKVVKFAKKGMTLLVTGPIVYKTQQSDDDQIMTMAEIKAIRIQKIVGSYHSKRYNLDYKTSEQDNKESNNAA